MAYRILVLILAYTLAAATAQAQRITTETQARQYIEGAFNTDAAHAILSENVSISPELRGRLGLAPEVGSRRIYDRLTSLTEGKTVSVRRASVAEVAGTPGSNLADPLFVVEAGDLKILVQYNLQRDNIHFLDEFGRPAPQPARAVAVANVQSVSSPPASAVAAVSLAPVLFDLGKATLGEQAKARLESEALPKLMERSEARYVISGHADELGSPQFNQALSEKRAEAVRAYLVSSGIDASRISIVAFGHRLPERTCEGVKGRAERIACLAPNRRVTVELQPGPR